LQDKISEKKAKNDSHSIIKNLAAETCGSLVQKGESYQPDVDVSFFFG